MSKHTFHNDVVYDLTFLDELCRHDDNGLKRFPSLVRNLCRTLGVNPDEVSTFERLVRAAEDFGITVIPGNSPAHDYTFI